jgi:chemotaxis protein methyltransferase CheR
MTDVEDIEIGILLEGIHQRYGFDFRDYARASMRRRIHKRMEEEGVDTVSALQAHVLHDPDAMERLLLGITVNVTSMFRDPHFFEKLRTTVMPMLETYPFIRIWHAGCSTGEEVYSMAILLKEAGLYDRSRIYATDLSDVVLQVARNGIYPLRAMKDYTKNYLDAGGTRAFSDYYSADSENAILRRDLQDNIVFAQHNLASDAGFNEFHVIMCRNVMIYFERPLQDRVYQLLHDSLVRLGILALGKRESLRFSPLETHYQDIDARESIYRRMI